ncbi:Oidioi.mRNA.OKI2018_I69.chr1.g2085.t1.cds [Oikopleura dioica]|uniref:Oidioi.mRNA.OKI2018_I69.chr1.g2085.t1.cds n=1 Tax=Oikopleura dioica TaxID=34765 RepID=A0ABN7SQ03_OIKDI|nr:Oidioi.mRNA.OKI2018_I69.chr1.g2085.t1.cds [Oikopleura dioica]
MTFVLVENKGNMDKKAFLLLLGYIGYLFLGAAVFLHLEKSIQEEDCKYANTTLQMEIMDFGNQYFYDLGLNRKLCKGINRLDELYATASDHSHKEQVTELFTMWAEDDCSEERYTHVLARLTKEAENNTAFQDEFREVYGELIKFAGFESFDEEHLNITGAVFRNLMSRGVGIVTENYFTLIESCAEKWTFHSAFFFAGTVATTIGYGQLVPTTDESRIFCIVFAAIGIPYFAYMTSVISQSINNGLDRLTKKFGVTTSRLIYVLGGISVLVVIPVVGFVRIEEWTLVEAVYFSLISLSTIGFGDLVPREEPPTKYATHINNVTACYDTLTNPIPRSSRHVDPSQGDCKPNVYPESVELVFDVYRVCVFFWILTGLTWLGGIIQMVCSLVSNSRKNESQAVSMTESFLVTGGETEKVPVPCSCCADCIYRNQKVLNGKTAGESKPPKNGNVTKYIQNGNSNGSINLNLSKV